MLSSRKKRPLVRASATRDARLIVIATEGEKTEKIYFEAFKNSRLVLKVIENIDGKSSPRHILNNMDNYILNYQIGEGDELWLVIDVDAWTNIMLSDVATACLQKRIGLAVSNPCFEIWLACHYDRSLPDRVNSKSLTAHLKEVADGYNKSNYDPEKFLPLIDIAIKNARMLEANVADRWPQTCGTRVYLLAESIVEKFDIQSA